MREGRQRSAWGDFAAGPGWGSDPSFLSRVQCVALGLAEGTELYRPLKESPKVGGPQPEKEGKVRPGCFSDPLTP